MGRSLYMMHRASAYTAPCLPFVLAMRLRPESTIQFTDDMGPDAELDQAVM